MNFQKDYIELKTIHAIRVSKLEILKKQRELMLFDNVSPFLNTKELDLEIYRLTELILAEKIEISKIEKIIAKIVKDSNDTETSVFYYRYIKGMTHPQIAKKMSYSLPRIKQLSRQVREKIEKQ
jgi:DNA-directed RNA polymerase specialized sigma24 family protein